MNGSSDLLLWSIILAIALFWSLGGLLIGASRGRRGFGFVMGLLLGLVGWIIVGLMRREGPRCPECLGVVQDQARRCKHCGSELPAGLVVTQRNPFVRRVI